VTTIAQSEKATGMGFEKKYASVLREYALGAGESALGRAYELGRRAVAEQKSLMEVASVHHQALEELLADENPKRREELLRVGAEFLGECLSPYEMAHRGFQDGVKALRQLNETLEEEIKRIAYAVHDEAGQLLVAVHLALDEVARDLPKLHKERLTVTQDLLRQVEQQLRRYSHELRPTVLDDLGWVPAIRFLADAVSKRANLPIEVNADVSGRLPRAVELALYRIVQEGLNNATKHAKARRVSIRVYREDHELCCSVQDDGAGFDLAAVQSNRGRTGLGLTAMKERVNAIGAHLSIQSASGKGTTLLIRLPMEKDDGTSSSSRG
jgi:signal transduction histidine kinase